MSCPICVVGRVSESDPECPICIGRVSESDPDGYLHARCRRLFHYECLSRWLRQPEARDLCPCCRQCVDGFDEDDPERAHPLLREMLRTYFVGVRNAGWVDGHLLPPDPLELTSVLASRAELQEKEIPYKPLIRQPYEELYLPEMSPVIAVLDQLRAKQVHYSVVLHVEWQRAVHRETLYSISRYLQAQPLPATAPASPPPPERPVVVSILRRLLRNRIEEGEERRASTIVGATRGRRSRGRRRRGAGRSRS